MPKVILRETAGISGPEDIEVNVQERTFEYLMSSDAPEIRVSAYLEQDLAQVKPGYAELYVAEECSFVSLVRQLTPGSRIRSVQLPGEMKAGEQLTVVVTRSPR